jgi:hypothetical protein
MGLPLSNSALIAWQRLTPTGPIDVPATVGSMTLL